MEFDGLVEVAAAMAKAMTVERNARDPSRAAVFSAPCLVTGQRIAALLNRFRLLSANVNIPVAASIAADNGNAQAWGRSFVESMECQT